MKRYHFERSAGSRVAAGMAKRPRPLTITHAPVAKPGRPTSLEQDEPDGVLRFIRRGPRRGQEGSDRD